MRNGKKFLNHLTLRTRAALTVILQFVYDSHRQNFSFHSVFDGTLNSEVLKEIMYYFHIRFLQLKIIAVFQKYLLLIIFRQKTNFLKVIQDSVLDNVCKDQGHDNVKLTSEEAEIGKKKQASGNIIRRRVYI